MHGKRAWIVMIVCLLALACLAVVWLLKHQSCGILFDYLGVTTDAQASVLDGGLSQPNVQAVLADGTLTVTQALHDDWMLYLVCTVKSAGAALSDEPQGLVSDVYLEAQNGERIYCTGFGGVSEKEKKGELTCVLRAQLQKPLDADNAYNVVLLLGGDGAEELRFTLAPSSLSRTRYPDVAVREGTRAARVDISPLSVVVTLTSDASILDLPLSIRRQDGMMLDTQDMRSFGSSDVNFSEQGGVEVHGGTIGIVFDHVIDPDSLQSVIVGDAELAVTSD